MSPGNGRIPILQVEDLVTRFHTPEGVVFAVNGVSGFDEDVFICTPLTLGLTTTCTFQTALYFDGSTWNLSADDIDAIDLP